MNFELATEGEERSARERAARDSSTSQISCVSHSAPPGSENIAASTELTGGRMCLATLPVESSTPSRIEGSETSKYCHTCPPGWSGKCSPYSWPRAWSLADDFKGATHLFQEISAQARLSRLVPVAGRGHIRHRADVKFVLWAFGFFLITFGHGKRIEGSMVDIWIIRREVEFTRDHHPRPPGRVGLPRQPCLRLLTSDE